MTNLKKGQGVNCGDVYWYNIMLVCLKYGSDLMLDCGLLVLRDDTLIEIRARILKYTLLPKKRKGERGGGGSCAWFDDTYMYTRIEV